MNSKDREESHILGLLEAIEENSDVTQRGLAGQLGIALGLANSYLKRCVRKGLVKIHQAPANRYLYYLTPKGFAEKSRLTAEYLHISFVYYRKAGGACERIFSTCAARGWHRVALCGVSDLAEIAAVKALEYEVEVTGMFDADTTRTRFLGKPVWNQFAEVPPCDAYVLTSLSDPAAQWAMLVRLVDAERLLVPDILSIPSPSETAAEASSEAGRETDRVAEDHV
ncbi:MAG: winged helix-turn-helix transcriptional regulator [Pseudomonadota bacterium]